MTTTQDFVSIQAIKDSMVFLKDGSVTAVITTSAVNFGLLSEVEQVSIIESFAGFLNSLSFSVQIVIHSERLDVSSYLGLLDQAERNQTNPLMKSLIPRYRHFVERLIRENDVLDKQFYVAINVTLPELGLLNNQEEKAKKAATILIPRIDHVIRQLGRLGLKSKQLNSEELLTLFFNSYNDNMTTTQPTLVAAPPPTQSAPIPAPTIVLPPAPPAVTPAPVIPTPQPYTMAPPSFTHLGGPFVVEELRE